MCDELCAEGLRLVGLGLRPVVARPEMWLGVLLGARVWAVLWTAAAPVAPAVIPCRSLAISLAS